MSIKIVEKTTTSEILRQSIATSLSNVKLDGKTVAEIIPARKAEIEEAFVKYADAKVLFVAADNPGKVTDKNFTLHGQKALNRVEDGVRELSDASEAISGAIVQGLGVETTRIVMRKFTEAANEIASSLIGCRVR